MEAALGAKERREKGQKQSKLQARRLTETRVDIISYISEHIIERQ